MTVSISSLTLATPPAVVRTYLARAGARLLPGWERPTEVRVERGNVCYRVRAGVRRGRWSEHHVATDTGLVIGAPEAGPFGDARIVWTVDAEPPGARLHAALELRDPPPGNTRHALEHWLTWQARRIWRDTERLAARPLAPSAQRIALGGASGMIGTALREFLSAAGHTVIPLVRPDSATAGGIPWRPGRGDLDPAALEGIDAVIHLGGVSIAGSRWSEARKQAIRDSRVDSTRLLAERIASLERPPKVLICASAVGYYGDRGDAVLTEESPPGQGFMPDVCRAWEAAAEPARDAGVRVVHARIGLVLSPLGGALAELLPIFRLGLGGRLGTGRQFVSWIALEDIVGALHYLLANEDLAGPVNLTAPRPETNLRFAKAIGQVLHRPALVPVPAFGIRLALGEMGTRLLLEGNRVRPQVLERSGFAFALPSLPDALAWELGR